MVYESTEGLEAKAFKHRNANNSRPWSKLQNLQECIWSKLHHMKKDQKLARTQGVLIFFKPLAQKTVTIDQDLKRITRNSRPCSKLPKLVRMFFSSAFVPNSITGTKLRNLKEMQRMLKSFATFTIDRDLKSCKTIRRGLGRCCCARNEW